MKNLNHLHMPTCFKGFTEHPYLFVIISQKVMRRFIQRLLKSRLVIA